MATELNTLPHYKKVWAFQLKETYRRKWPKEEFSKLVFEWHDIERPSRFTQSKIAIEIAKAHTDFSTDYIEDLAKDIYNFSKIKRGDYVLGVLGDKFVERTGFVEGVSEITNEVKIDITWIGLAKESNAKKPVFDAQKEIQSINSRMLRSLNVDFKLLGRFAPQNRDDFRGASEAYSMAYQKMPDFFVGEDDGDDDNGSVKVPLFYGTNRNITGKLSPQNFFGDNVEDLTQGTCVVSIPTTHMLGEMERPNFWLGEFKERPDKHVVLESIKQMSDGDFENYFSKIFNESKEKSALIFVHGYNVSFTEAARRTAQIAWDIPFRGVSGFFSWPSSSGVMTYLGCIEKADVSISPLEKFIEKIILQQGIKKLHLIAHSMGNRILTVSLNNLSLKPALKEKLNVISQIVLGAADIDQVVFKTNILPEFKNIGERRTVYSSDNDGALRFSEILRSSEPRLGMGGEQVFVADGIDTIDASNLTPKGNGHGYLYDANELLSDLNNLLNYGHPSNERRLRQKKKNSLLYWLFPH